MAASKPSSSRQQRRLEAKRRKLTDRALATARRRFLDGRIDEAVAICFEIDEDPPRNPDVLLLLGDIAHTGRNFKMAVELLRASVAIRPDHFRTNVALGQALLSVGDMQAAEHCFAGLCIRYPDEPEPHVGLARVFRDQARHHEAAAAYADGLARQPDNMDAHSGLLMSLQYDESAGPQQRLDAAREFGHRFGAAAGGPGHHFSNARDPGRRLRVGYISPTLQTHPVGIFLSAVWAAHDREAFEIVAYSGVLVEDNITRLLKSFTKGWRSTVNLSDEALIDAIRADGIDILVDLDGHSGGQRLAVFAAQAAPVQVSWLGYPDTIGLPAVNYVITDPVTVPPGADQWFTEDVIRLPHQRFCFTPLHNAPDVAEPPSARLGHPTFGSFNNPTKMSDAVIGLWCRVLQAVPDSRLILKWKTLAKVEEQRRISRRFAERGIDPGRLDLRRDVAFGKHLAEYADMDVALDPFPFSGGMTSCEALWQGVPVVTLPRRRPASRQTLAFLTALDLTELAAKNEDEYVRIAADLARDTQRLRRLRAEQRARMAGSALCDGAGFTRNLEAAYRATWQRWCEEG